MSFATRRFPASLVALLAAASLFALGVVNALTMASIRSSRPWVQRTRDVQALISRTLGALVDAETAQRGFLLTGDVDYLGPFTRGDAAVYASLTDLVRLTADDPLQRRNVAELQRLAEDKLAEISKTIDLRQGGEPAQALAIVRSNEGEALMGRVRQLVDDMRVYEDKRLEDRTAGMRRDFDRATWIATAAGGGLLALGFVLFLIHRDIARREALESALREEAKFQQQFIGILSHDLRNPLGAISMSANQLRSSVSVDRLGIVSRIESSAARMSRMIAQLLDLTRARLGDGIPISPRPATSLHEVLNGAVDELRTVHPEASVRLELGEDVRGVWDPDRISEVISNLVANAIRYGDGTVDVCVRRTDSTAILEVHNGGVPIPRDVLPTIFAPFRRAANGKDGGAQGLGLGLYIAERIVAAHGGYVEVRSTSSDGTTFSVGLPLDPRLFEPHATGSVPTKAHA